MADILECIAGVLWIALGIYTGLKVRRLTKWMDASIDKLDATFERGEENGPW